MGQCITKAKASKSERSRSNATSQAPKSGGSASNVSPQASNPGGAASTAGPQGSRSRGSASNTSPRASEPNKSASTAAPQVSRSGRSTSKASPRASEPSESASIAAPQISKSRGSASRASPRASESNKSASTVTLQVSRSGRSASRASPRASEPSESASNTAPRVPRPGRSAHNASTEASTSAASTSEDHSFGIKVLHEGHQPEVDIVAVHGLNGHRETTWTTAGGVNWLRHLLPERIPNARVLSWGYDANTHRDTGVSSRDLYEHARTLVSELCSARADAKTRERPIIFIAHSLGGIVLKSALVHSKLAGLGAFEKHRSIELSTYGIFFMGTPQQDTNGVALGEFLLKLAPEFVRSTDEPVEKLKEGSGFLGQQFNHYGLIRNAFVTKFAYEEYPTHIVGGQPVLIVPRVSAVVPGTADADTLGIHANHIDMVKFDSRTSNDYLNVSGHLMKMASEACNRIEQVWEKEKRFKRDMQHSSPPK